jgi:hypothetical protein
MVYRGVAVHFFPFPIHMAMCYVYRYLEEELVLKEMLKEILKEMLKEMLTILYGNPFG